MHYSYQKILVVVVMAIFIAVGLAGTVYGFYKCGAMAFILGNRAFWAAMFGMCG